MLFCWGWFCCLLRSIRPWRIVAGPTLRAVSTANIATVRVHAAAQISPGATRPITVMVVVPTVAKTSPVGWIPLTTTDIVPPAARTLLVVTTLATAMAVLHVAVQTFRTAMKPAIATAEAPVAAPISVAGRRRHTPTAMASAGKRIAITF